MRSKLRNLKKRLNQKGKKGGAVASIHFLLPGRMSHELRRIVRCRSLDLQKDSSMENSHEFFFVSSLKMVQTLLQAAVVVVLLLYYDLNIKIT